MKNKGACRRWKGLRSEMAKAIFSVRMPPHGAKGSIVFVGGISSS